MEAVCPRHGVTEFTPPEPHTEGTATCDRCKAEGLPPMNPYGLVHLYGQGGWHQEAYIVGDPRGLTVLRDAIDKALSSPGAQGQAHVSVADGEGYTVHVLNHPSERMGRVTLPYVDHPGPSEGYREPYTLVADVEGDEILGDDAYFEWKRRIEAQGG